jgi:hypothetical protein
MDLEAIRRRLRGLAALAKDAGATAHERANAEALKARLQQQLKDAGVPAGDWTDTLFRLGRRVRQAKDDTAPASPKGDWTDGAHRLGKGLRRGWKKWSSH